MGAAQVQAPLLSLPEIADWRINYGARYEKGLPISSGIAESAVNQVVRLRMAKKRQMYWSDEGAHVLALVRVAELNGELSVQTFGHITQTRPSVVERSRNEFLAIAA
jgi:hypothetical protein